MRVVMKPKFRHEHFVLGMVNLARAGGSFLFLLMVAAFQAMLSEAHFHHASGFLEMMLSFGLSQSKVYILLPLAVELTYLIGFFYLNKAYKCFYSSSQICAGKRQTQYLKELKLLSVDTYAPKLEPPTTPPASQGQVGLP